MNVSPYSSHWGDLTETTKQAEIENRTFILMKLKLCSCTPQCMLATKDRAK
jgi:hypothetical protein